MTKSRLYEFLSAHFFTMLECRELSTLGKINPTLKAIVSDREVRRSQFEKVAASKIAKGAWRRPEVPFKWLDYLAKMYSKNNWRVQEGARGRQKDMPKNSPNPWSLYRAFEKLYPSKRGVSPWELGRPHGKNRLEMGLIFVQRLERELKKGTCKTTTTQIRNWILQKEIAVRKSHDKQRKGQLRIEINRLERLL